MDNHFVPNLTIGPMVCRSLRDANIDCPIDVHLMVQPVDDLIKMFADSGATSITFHPFFEQTSDKTKVHTITHFWNSKLEHTNKVNFLLTIM